MFILSEFVDCHPTAIVELEDAADFNRVRTGHIVMLQGQAIDAPSLDYGAALTEGCHGSTEQEVVTSHHDIAVNGTAIKPVLRGDEYLRS